MGRRRVRRQKTLASLTRVNTKAAEVFGSQVAANGAGNYIRQLSLEVVCSSRHDSRSASQMCCSEELLVAPAQLSQRDSGEGFYAGRGVLCGGGKAVAIFNTGASKSPKALRGGPHTPLHHRQLHEVSSLGDPRVCGVTDGRLLGGGAETPVIDPLFSPHLCTDSTFGGGGRNAGPRRTCCYVLINQAGHLVLSFLSLEKEKQQKPADGLFLINHIRPTLLLH